MEESRSAVIVRLAHSRVRSSMLCASSKMTTWPGRGVGVHETEGLEYLRLGLEYLREWGWSTYGKGGWRTWERGWSTWEGLRYVLRVEYLGGGKHTASEYKCGEDTKGHIVPRIEHGVPGIEHGVPGIEHGVPAIEHGVPGIEHGVPGNEHGVPGNEHGVPGI